MALNGTSPGTDLAGAPAAVIAASAEPPLLEVRALAVQYRLDRETVHAVRSVSLSVAPGETVAVVGESGSGKSTTAHAIVGLLPPTSRITGGEVSFRGQDLTRLPERRLRTLRGVKIGLIPQDPSTSLNPVKRIGEQVAEVLVLHGLANRREAREKAVEALAEAGLTEPAARARQYPHELSGGMRQRVLIAIATVAKPELIVADEPTSALDVTVQRRILDRIERLTTESRTGVLLITHDLGVAAERAQRIVVMSKGEVVEFGPSEQIVNDPQHPYTQSLIMAAPSLSARRGAPAIVRPSSGPAGVSVAAGTAGDPFAEATGDLPRLGEPHVVVEHLTKDFRLSHAASGDGVLRAVDDVSFTIRRGQTYALVGESGSGKSTTARLVLRLAEPTGGRVAIDGLDVTGVRGSQLRLLRRRMQLVYQNPYASLNPKFTVEQIITDPLRAFGLGTRAQQRARAAALVDKVALPSAALHRKPAELSGGQRQRVAIARALALNPDLVVCDEPVSALDVSVQAQILELLGELQRELGLTYLFISHDLAVIRLLAHEVGVMRTGQMVESGPTDDVLSHPQHAYTQELLASIPQPHHRHAD